ncbi:xanthan lyase-like isoform X1 [Leguminivora glycinivorella]|uniref:xanthan lyase-like isoform X1 n=1 Tax=Leguminivora glycinivorella TaxID=1035111 RepID=UPI0020104D90|nr:xanthan lyase-like isoform X1 [Leguminivora glycinivorella]
MARDAVESFIDCVERAFVPLIYQGQMIAPVNGLAISRSPLATQFRNQVATMYNLLVIAQFASTGTENKLKEAVKYWMRQNPNYYLSNTRNYNELLMIISLLNDSAIKGDQLPFVGTKMYASMDRFVQQTPKYMLALSLYSKRISAYEAGNKENKRGWHTADGAMYLYNYDNLQFGDSYWPTVDPYRLPGTTVDTRYLNDEVADYSDFMSNEEWVGGVANSNQAVVGMALNKEGFKSNWRPLAMDLKGKKSWFIVEGQIIALGAGITGSTEATIETIVENRLLGDLYGNKVLSNSQEITSTSAGIDADWLLLESGNNNLSIGYYFPDGENVDVIYDARSGNYMYINEATPAVDYYGRYAKFIINHGQSPVDAKYAYVILPGIKQDELKEYVESQPVQILENSAQIQAVQLINEGYLGINVWSETGGTIEGISSDMPVSLMRQTHDYIDTYVVSDPTQSDRVVTIKIPDFSKVATMSEGVYYDVKNNAFTVDFTNDRGASKQFTVYNEVNNFWPYTSMKLDQKDDDMFPDTFDQ